MALPENPVAVPARQLHANSVQPLAGKIHLVISSKSQVPHSNSAQLLVLVLQTMSTHADNAVHP
jgi:hypothetical protein